MIELSVGQQQALDQVRAEPLKIIDQRTKQTYVLLRADEYDQLLAGADDNIDMRQVAELVERNMKEYDLGDSVLESYQDKVSS